jgi:hypothetical protein
MAEIERLLSAMETVRELYSEKIERLSRIEDKYVNLCQVLNEQAGEIKRLDTLHHETALSLDTMTAERDLLKRDRQHELAYIEEVLCNICRQNGEQARESANDTLKWLRNRRTCFQSEPPGHDRAVTDPIDVEP